MPLPFPCAYIVVHEPSQPVQKYQPLYAELQNSFKWARYMANTWIVLRYDALFEMHSKIIPLIFNTDRLLIMPAKGPGAGWLPQEAWNWIDENVPKEW